MLLIALVLIIAGALLAAFVERTVGVLLVVAGLIVLLVALVGDLDSADAAVLALMGADVG